ncbi:MAG: molecular chaperone GroES, partial [Candidatus Adiutrix intracellularis]
MNVRPLSDRVLVKRLEEEETTKGGIIIPDTAKEKPQQGKIIAIGEGKLLDNGTRINPAVKVGEVVL